jgi:hypothetical protein
VSGARRWHVRDVVLIGEVVDDLIERLDEGRDRARGK